ncbi:cell division protein SepF [Acaryochloris marina]|uniref:cell division protein SepF n=1 Tax=Acaryochloris marina TaxID=155978 RepID=UPI001BB00DE2|nr:cell division protein SepF [Acaryochloris marina]QUY46256.1 cell division protein SepF [Acaryochloris marina S15]
MHNLTPFPGTSLTEIFLSNPKSFSDADTAISHLKAGELILVNSKHLAGDSAQRIIDYLAGSVQSLDGQFTEVGNGVYLFSPPTIPTQKFSSPPSKK